TLLVTAAPAKSQFHIGLKLRPGRQQSEVSGFVKNSGGRIHGHPPELPVRKLQPLPLRRTPRRYRECRRDPPPSFPLLVLIGRDRGDGERGNPPPRVAYANGGPDVGPGKDVVRDLDFQL